MKLVGVSIVLLAMVGGCVRYEYDVVQPAGVARHVGKNWEEFNVDPLMYRMATYESRLVIGIHNPTQDAMHLLGDRSYVIAPNGQSHPLPSQTIAPQTYIRLVLPPMRPYYERSGPTFGFGMGMGYGRHGYRHGGYYGGYGLGWGGPWYDSSRYYVSYNDSNPFFWEWEGETEVKLHLVFGRGPATFAHDMVLGRVKM